MLDNKIDLDLLGESKVKYTDYEIAKRYLNKRNNAKERGIGFELSLTRMKQLLNTKNCFFTGVKLTKSNFSIDRLDSSIGYTDKNVVACEINFNRIKADLDIKGLAAVIRGMQKNKIKLSNENFEIRIYARKKKK